MRAIGRDRAARIMGAPPCGAERSRPRLDLFFVAAAENLRGAAGTSKVVCMTGTITLAGITFMDDDWESLGEETRRALLLAAGETGGGAHARWPRHAAAAPAPRRTVPRLRRWPVPARRGSA
jgi:hypothetical protein